MLKIHILLMLLFFCLNVSAIEDLPLWEYGGGIGYVLFEEYPASKTTRDLVVPFPTFQYRGEILRADDQEGARANLLKSPYGSLQLGGNVLPEVNSGRVEAREGMDSIPWGIQIGPQWVYWPSDDIELKLGVYQGLLMNLQKTSTNGYLSEVTGIWHIDDQLTASGGFPGATRVEGRVALTLRAADRQFLGTYYDVSPAEARPWRPAYEARGGWLSWNLSYVQSVQVRKLNVYAGLSDAHYTISSNRASPLHQSDRNLSVFAGISYNFGESEARAIPEREGRGLLNRGARGARAL